ncbi:spore coat protein SA [Caldalkalibacillus uzonensis]|uniref:Spore coat protein SA n=1 Tax=Caldalkalibacillus uzonensis TaxID=353224 RepID=A0ABU0CSX2_9BACI|nr:glycosyltransferase family 4 protein [Caldalkalibacillus uzonensis]MDQ0339001.1 spore coat protein SA [Caldalkalibacillus uzonensis]
MKIVFVSPGKFSVPPVIGTSVEHDIEMVGKSLYPHHVVIYTRKCEEYPVSTQEGHVEYRRFTYHHWRDYLQLVLEDLKRFHPDIIQVENRPQYISIIKNHFPHTPVVLNMHSLTFISSRLISTEEANHAMGQVDALITNSRFLQREYEERFPQVEGKTYGIHLGIAPEHYRAAEKAKQKLRNLKNIYGIQQGDRVLLFVGRIIKGKGLHHLINAMHQIRNRHESVKLLVVGSPRYGRNTSTRYFRRIKKEAKRLKDCIIFTQFIKPEDMPYMYQLADVVVTPSTGKEALCRVNLEAMASKKPVVTTDSGGIPEIVIDNETGYVVPIENISEQLPQKINKLLQSKTLRKRFGENGLARVKDFTWEQTAKAYVNVYRKLIK